jgi:hypothetical protein
VQPYALVPVESQVTGEPAARCHETDGDVPSSERDRQLEVAVVGDDDHGIDISFEGVGK